MKGKIFLFIPFILIFLILLLFEFPVFESMEMKFYDVLTKYLYKPKKVDKIVIIGIDDKSLENLKDPIALWTRYFEKILEKISQYNPSAIGFDFLVLKIPEKDLISFSHTLLNLKKKKIPFILPFAIKDEEFQYPPALLIFSSSGIGYINISEDPDGKVRRLTLYSFQKGDTIYSFPYALYKSLNKTKNFEQEYLIQDFVSDFKIYSFYEILKRAEKGDTLYFKRFKNKIILIGAISKKLWDIFEVPKLNNKFLISGVELHAISLKNLLLGNKIKKIPYVFEILILLIFASFIFLGNRFLDIIKSTLLFGFILFIYLIGVIVAYKNSILLPFISDVFLVILSQVFELSVQFFTREKEFKIIKDYFSAYVGPDVLKEILKNPDRLGLKGVKKVITVMFVDIAGFTRFSEDKEPEEIVKFLNKYFEVITNCVTENKGYIDKLIGDGVLCFFGILGDEDRGVKNAIECAEAIIAETGKQGIKVGIGIHTGEVIIGNVGTKEVLDYTAVGDTVNTAVKIESLTRTKNIPVLISEATKKYCKGELKIVEEKAQIPSKTKRLSLYTI